MVTAHGRVPDAVEAMKLGAIDFVAKPVRPEELRRVVGEVVNRHDPAARPRDVVAVESPMIDLSPAKVALNRRDFDRAEDLLREATEQYPDSAEAQTLMGVLREALGEEHAAYRCYRAALEADPRYEPAAQNLKRYCAHYGLDAGNPAINPAARA
jgi:tetratricopeptide (TPR) repeat protein